MIDKELIKEIIFGVAPIGAGCYLYNQNKVLSILLLFFGCVIIGFIVWNYLEREKAMRSHIGYGHLRS
ncbi:hypothetical protein COV19_03755 [Candidatus Woesearchaeota archaeon CG10_big_fil_rev_8_21_14_0_10_44_13]|nr:MAG: hypothetical protein COV19_03755 [Candidatus Woesearchaeota archaeon CG10_big_fil_rev_8_21_14_0_10_44_13]